MGTAPTKLAMEKPGLGELRGLGPSALETDHSVRQREATAKTLCLRLDRLVVATCHALSGDPKNESLYRVLCKVYIGFGVNPI